MNLLFILQLAFWTPLAGALLIVATGRHAVIRDAVSLATAIMLFGSLLLLAPAVFGGARPALALLEPLPGLPLQLTLEPLGMLFAALASALVLAASPVAAQSILRDAETEALLRDMAEPLIEASELEPGNVEIVLINDSSINAFVAGGQVQAADGLVAALGVDEALSHDRGVGQAAPRL